MIKVGSPSRISTLISRFRYAAGKIDLVLADEAALELSAHEKVAEAVRKLEINISGETIYAIYNKETLSAIAAALAELNKAKG